MGAMATQKPGIDNHDHHLASTMWVPRAVRCAHCGEIAREEVRERVSDDEVVVRFGCSHCRWRQTRHYHESELVH
jgi:hypothetical protein